MGIRCELMLLMTGRSELCFRKAAYQQFVAEGRVHSLTVVITNAGANRVAAEQEAQG